jgi:hypothetical protein
MPDVSRTSYPVDLHPSSTDADSDEGGAATGAAHVYFGGVAPDAVADCVLTGEEPDDLFGFAVDGVGDANADGFSDLIVGAPNNDGAGFNAGRAYLYALLPPTSAPPPLPEAGKLTLFAPHPNPCAGPGGSTRDGPLRAVRCARENADQPGSRRVRDGWTPQRTLGSRSSGLGHVLRSVDHGVRPDPGDAVDRAAVGCSRCLRQAGESASPSYS